MSDPTQTGPASVSIEDIEKQMAASKGTDLSVKLAGDGVPEELRGKTMAEVMAMQKGMTDALMISEKARKDAEIEAAVHKAQPPVAPPAAPKEEPKVKEYTDEEIAEIHQEDPIKAIKILNDRAIRTAERNLETRLGPMLDGTVASVEENARTKYADDFEAIGPEIEMFIQALPNKRVLANPQGWDDLIALVRGRNFDKVIEHKAAKAAIPQAEAAKAAQLVETGFHASGGPAPAANAKSVPGKVEDLDAIQVEIAGKLGMTLEDYVKWGAVTQ